MIAVYLMLERLHDHAFRVAVRSWTTPVKSPGARELEKWMEIENYTEVLMINVEYGKTRVGQDQDRNLGEASVVCRPGSNHA